MGDAESALKVLFELLAPGSSSLRTRAPASDSLLSDSRISLEQREAYAASLLELLKVQRARCFPLICANESYRRPRLLRRPRQAPSPSTWRTLLLSVRRSSPSQRIPNSSWQSTAKSFSGTPPPTSALQSPSSSPSPRLPPLAPPPSSSKSYRSSSPMVALLSSLRTRNWLRMREWWSDTRLGSGEMGRWRSERWRYRLCGGTDRRRSLTEQWRRRAS